MNMLGTESRRLFGLGGLWAAKVQGVSRVCMTEAGCSAIASMCALGLLVPRAKGLWTAF